MTDPIQLERDNLRAQQARDVMPLIGQLLDAWEGCSQRCREEFPELDKQLRRINRAMEDAHTQAPAWIHPWPPVLAGCRVCGIGANGAVIGYVCPRADCPTAVRCSSAIHGATP